MPNGIVKPGRGCGGASEVRHALKTTGTRRVASNEACLRPERQEMSPRVCGLQVVLHDLPVAQMNRWPVGADTHDVTSMIGRKHSVEAIAVREIDATGDECLSNGGRDPSGRKRLSQAQKGLNDPVVDAAPE